MNSIYRKRGTERNRENANDVSKLSTCSLFQLLFSGWHIWEDIFYKWIGPIELHCIIWLRMIIVSFNAKRYNATIQRKTKKTSITCLNSPHVHQFNRLVSQKILSPFDFYLFRLGIDDYDSITIQHFWKHLNFLNSYLKILLRICCIDYHVLRFDSKIYNREVIEFRQVEDRFMMTEIFFWKLKALIEYGHIYDEFTKTGIIIFNGWEWLWNNTNETFQFKEFHHKSNYKS